MNTIIYNQKIYNPPDKDGEMAKILEENRELSCIPIWGLFAVISKIELIHELYFM